MIKTCFVKRTFNGWGCISELPSVVESFNAKNVLIVTDPFLEQNGTAHRIVQILEPLNVRCSINSEVVPEPAIEVGERIVKNSRDQKIDLVIGLGGGSAIDLAKLVATLTTQDGNVSEYLNLTGNRKIQNQGLPKIMIPTTSGTGSEVTNISVLSLESSKDVIVDDSLLADVVILDPELTITVPPKVTASTGVDALTHAIESFVSRYATPITEGLSLAAIRLISKSIRIAVKDGSNQQARTDMSYGSYIAGLAFFNAGCAAVHALAYPLGGQFHIPHGESNAVLLPYVMSYIRSSCENKLKEIYKNMGFEVSGLSASEASLKCIKELVNLVRDVGIPQSLQDFGIPSEAIPSLTSDALLQTRLLDRSPMQLEEADISKIYVAAHQGSKLRG
ncbi:iron-containing alcohol dehydrogenase [Taylorella equigenitalis]|uniref:Alcohol dehydrogenase n=2 Tax=Taylorella equigenitalis TaxID=29575 RepID=I7IJT1_9BURK|nr:iron-containing alcohol dehydrogenase [Taylorella equigenitalis]CCG18604.1 alcohol dehydrogenase [Taylorella equigenitalis 14/56]ASY30684.1 alcohol dehydrogenase [Taylorella equigenitalis]KOS58296.1 alcohol dehydrogenase [Taylorella equigenitalis]WDU45834.1 iron-containing alcohol dehydrogenase [Taylorella equigenitalis]WDU51302.1 iron-containing alcohol dehydrogenase [Taylorella equigenitalis]